MAFNKFQSFMKEKKNEFIAERHQKVLTQLANQDRTLTQLEINKDHDDEFLELAFESLLTNRFVTKIRVYGREMADSLPSLAACLSKSKTIVVLRLSNCGLEDTAITSLCGGLIKNTSVVSLGLDNNQISSAQGVCLLLQHNKTLEHIDLNNNLLGQNGDLEFQAISDALPTSNLKQLDIQGNGMSDTAGKRFCLMLEKNLMEMSLKTLNIGEEQSVRTDTRKFLNSLIESKQQRLLAQQRAEAAGAAEMSSMNNNGGSTRELQGAGGSTDNLTGGGNTPRPVEGNGSLPASTRAIETSDVAAGTDAVVVLSVFEHQQLLARISNLEKEFANANSRAINAEDKLKKQKKEGDDSGSENGDEEHPKEAEGDENSNTPPQKALSQSPGLSPRVSTEGAAGASPSPTHSPLPPQTLAPTVLLSEHNATVQSLKDQLSSITKDHEEVLGQYEAVAKEKDRLSTESIELNRKVSKLSIESERGKSYQEQVQALQQTQILSEKEIENLRESLNELQAKQIAELSAVSESNRNLREQLDKSAATISQASETRDTLLNKALETEKSLQVAMQKASSYQRALESLTTSTVDVTACIPGLLAAGGGSSSTTNGNGMDLGASGSGGRTDRGMLTEILSARERANLSPRKPKKKRKKSIAPSSTRESDPSTQAMSQQEKQEIRRAGSWVEEDFDNEEELKDSMGMTKDRWIPDETVRFCMSGCGKKFSMTLRKHHCRRCGRIFCDTCCQKSPAHEGRRMCVLCLH